VKKAAITAAVLAVIISLSAGSVYAAGQIARSSAIGEETARNFAYTDAGILPENAEVIRTEFDFEHGRFVYEIEFSVDGTHYEYTVDSSSGEILERESETVSSPRSDAPVPVSSQLTAESMEAQGSEDSASLISVDKAKIIALERAGVAEADAVFTKEKLERENGRQIYDVEFYIVGDSEYDYEIDAETGGILEESMKAWDEELDPAYGHDGRDLKEQGNLGAASSNEQSETISVDEAKSIALNQAGLSAEDVIFRKAKLEHDDGKRIYDIEFYATAGAEYEYEIDAYSGTILDEEIEPLDLDN